MDHSKRFLLLDVMPQIRNSFGYKQMYLPLGKAIHFHFHFGKMERQFIFTLGKISLNGEHKDYDVGWEDEKAYVM